MQDSTVAPVQTGNTPAQVTPQAPAAKTTDTESTAPSTAPAAAQPKQPSKFGRIMGSVLGGALNVIAPGAGALVGNLIKGGGSDFGSMETLLAQSAEQQMRMITLQQRVQNQTQEFTTISNLLKARHDGEMAAVHNFKS